MDKHILRRKLLDVIRRWQAPVTLSDILADADLTMRLESALLTTERISEELRNLVLKGYLQDLRPGRAPLFRITGAGIDQIDREGNLHEYIWGEHASF